MAVGFPAWPGQSPGRASNPPPSKTLPAGDGILQSARPCGVRSRESALARPRPIGSDRSDRQSAHSVPARSAGFPSAGPDSRESRAMLSPRPGERPAQAAQTLARGALFAMALAAAPPQEWRKRPRSWCNIPGYASGRTLCSTLQLEDDIPAVTSECRKLGKQHRITPVQVVNHRPKFYHAPSHGQELAAGHANAGKNLAQDSNLALSQRLLVRGTRLARVGESLPGPVQQWVFAPGFTEEGKPARLQDSKKLPASNADVQMVQDGIPPDA